MVFKTRFTPRARAGVVFALPSRTKQSFAGEADINSIMARYNATGCLVDPAVQARATRRPFWADVSDVPDFQTMRNTIARADQEFAMLPAVLRERFGNDPAQLLAFVADEKNRPEAVRLGLVQAVEAVKEAVPTDQPGAPTTPPKADSAAPADTGAHSDT